MRRTFPVLALLALAACGGSEGGGFSFLAEGGDPICAGLVAEYAAALPAAKVCLAREACDATRPQPIRSDGQLIGLSCSTRLTSTRTAALDAILARFDAAGCEPLGLPCPSPGFEAPACGGDGRCP